MSSRALRLLLALVSTWQLAFHIYDVCGDAAASAPELGMHARGGHDALAFDAVDADDAIPPLLSAALPSPQDELRGALRPVLHAGAPVPPAARGTGPARLARARGAGPAPDAPRLLILQASVRRQLAPPLA